jgi:hypothetical protein
MTKMLKRDKGTVPLSRSMCRFLRSKPDTDKPPLPGVTAAAGVALLLFKTSRLIYGIIAVGRVGLFERSPVALREGDRGAAECIVGVVGE